LFNLLLLLPVQTLKVIQFAYVLYGPHQYFKVIYAHVHPLPSCKAVTHSLVMNVKEHYANWVYIFLVLTRQGEALLFIEHV